MKALASVALRNATMVARTAAVVTGTRNRACWKGYSSPVSSSRVSIMITSPDSAARNAGAIPKCDAGLPGSELEIDEGIGICSTQKRDDGRQNRVSECYR